MGRRKKHKSNGASENPSDLIVHVYNRQKDLLLDKGAIRSLVRSVLEHEALSCEEVGIYLVTEKKISKIHAQFFQDPTPTDCISFPIDQKHLGEIFVCPSVAISYARKKSLNPFEETALYIVHGLLHLLGYDDLTPEERRTMRKKEKSCMRHLYKQGITLYPR